MHRQAQILSETARDFLSAYLPHQGSDWWQRLVIRELSWGQGRTANEQGWTSLDDLDLAALIRVIDRNWDLFRRKNLVSYEARNWLKEASSIRNRLAHQSGREAPKSQQYRDLDTLTRLCEALGADQGVVTELQQSRDAVLAVRDEPSNKPSNTPNTTKAKGANQGPHSPGDMVRLVARPETEGPVMEFLPGKAEDRYRVFVDNKPQLFYASQIEPQLPPRVEHLSVKDLHSRLTAVQLLHPSTAFLHSLSAGRVEFEPYQYRPVLKMIRADRPRLLIADDVGVGKTIEAGLILKELQARQDVESVLVICPKPLVTEHKWRQELRRFDEDFTHLDGPTLRHCLSETRAEGHWPKRYQKAIVPFSLLDEHLLMGNPSRKPPRPGLIDMDPPPKFDLVIVDEAHYVRNRDTWRYRNVRQLISGADAVVFLTATPIQTSSDDLYTILNLLRPDLISNPRSFELMMEPNPHLGEAASLARVGGKGWQESAAESFRAALNTKWGSQVLAAEPQVGELVDMLGGERLDKAGRVSAVRKLEATNSFAQVINRTRRRDIGEFTTRKPETVEVEFSTDQAAVYQELMNLSRQIAQHKTPGQPLEFLLSTLQRQASSSLNGLSPFINDILKSRLSTEEVSAADGDERSLDPSLLAMFQDQVGELAQLAQLLGDDDPKFDALLAIVSEKQALPNNKLLLFSTFRHTLAYLDRRLANDKSRVGLIHGGIPDEDRVHLRARFKMDPSDPDAIDILLSSEVGTEGLDYQFCDSLVNYDLPWNPMRVEQRIGRIDRRGQASRSIAIKNLVTPGTVDAAIYERCLQRIGVFQNALGGSEEVFGELTRDMRTIAENLELTDVERDQRLQQLADNKINRVLELERLEQEQSGLFGLQVGESADKEVADATTSWLSPQMIAKLVANYLSTVDSSRTISLGATGIAVLRASEETRRRLRHDVDAKDQTPWSRWLKGNNPIRRLTLDPQAADEDRQIELLTPVHPLVRAAAKILQGSGTNLVNLTAASGEIPVGRYPFGVYAWNRQGVRDDSILQVICTEASHQGTIAQLLTTASDATPDALSDGENAAIEDSHYRQWSDSQADHLEKTQSTCELRLASLEATHRARLAQLEDQAARASDPSIMRMRDAEIRNAEADFASRAQELKSASKRCTLRSEPLILGTLEVTSP